MVEFFLVLFLEALETAYPYLLFIYYAFFYIPFMTGYVIFCYTLLNMYLLFLVYLVYIYHKYIKNPNELH